MKKLQETGTGICVMYWCLPDSRRTKTSSGYSFRSGYRGTYSEMAEKMTLEVKIGQMCEITIDVDE